MFYKETYSWFTFITIILRRVYGVTQMRMRQNYTRCANKMITFGDVSGVLTSRDEILGFSGLTYAASFTSNNLM